MKYEPSICLLVAVSTAQGHVQDNPVLGRPSFKYLAVLWAYVLNLASTMAHLKFVRCQEKVGKKCRVLVGIVYQLLTV